MFLCKSQMELMEACGITCWELHIPPGTSMVQLTLLLTCGSSMRLCYFHQGIRFIKLCSQPSHGQVFLQSSILLKIEVSTFHGCMIMYVITFADGVFRNGSVGFFPGDALRKTSAFGLCDPMCHSEPGIVCSNQLPLFGHVEPFKGRISRS